MNDFHSNTPPTSRSTFGVLWIALVLVVVYLLRYVLLPFAVAGAFAFVASPLVRLMQQRFSWQRWVGALLVFLGYLCGFSLIGYLIARFAAPQLVAVINDLPNTLHRFFSVLFGGEEANFLGSHLNAARLSQRLSEWSVQSPNAGSPDLRSVLEAFGAGVASVMGLVLTLVLLLYFLVESPRLGRGAMWLVPPAHRDRAAAIARRAGPVLYRYVVGVFVVVFCTILMTWIFMRWWLHLPHAELLAMAVGLLEMIPVLGPALSTAIIALVAIEQLTLGMIISVAIFATALRVLLDQFIGPMILGQATRLPPPVVIFAFLAGGVIYGALGVLLAIPAIAVGRIVLEEMGWDEK
jgi:predicted PurR-regulated permease PerM